MHANYQWLPGTEAFALSGFISLLFSNIKIQALGPSGNPTTLKIWLRLPLLSLCLYLTISIETYYDYNKEIVQKKGGLSSSPAFSSLYKKTNRGCGRK
jgi:hypothetical protein